MVTYTEATAFIWSLTDYERRTGYDYSASRFDLGRVRQLLDRLGRPQEHMALAHVAGTKGKGSTSALLAGILRQSGRKVGLYTSPHLHTVRERIQVDGKPIGRAEFAAAVGSVAEAMRGIEGITSFEALTAAAFLAFATASVELAVIEVGLGGRLDATNVIAPFVSVITSLSLDHTAILGDSLEAIAAEKAGIIKPGVPVVSACQQPRAMCVIFQRAAALGCELESVGQEWRWAPGACADSWQEFELCGPERFAALADGEYRLGLLGLHQVENAALAVAAATKAPPWLGMRHEHIAGGLAETAWPGRFEVARRRPYVVLDGAHNVDSMLKLRAALERHLRFSRLHLVLGASRDKDLRGMLPAIAREDTSLYTCQSAHGRAASLADLAAASEGLAVSQRSFATVAEALDAALSAAREDDCVCATGSLFVVAEAREAVARRWGDVLETDGEVEVLSLAGHSED